MYENIKEIPNRLHANATGRTGICTPADHPLGFPVPEGHPIEPENDGQEKRPDLPEDVLNPSDGEPPVDNGDQEETSASPEEIQAAHTIETTYYRIMTRKKELKGIDATRARLWSLLHNRVSSMEWPRHTLISCLSRQYSGLYLSSTLPTLLPASDIPDRCTIGGLLHDYRNPPTDYFRIFPTIRSILRP